MYLTFSEFQELCPESDLTEEQFSAVEKKAEADIDAVTFNRITAKGFDSLTAFQKDRIKQAMASQVRFIHDNSELLDSPLSAYSVNGVSMSFDRSGVTQLGGTIITNRAYSVLMQTGLCYRGLM